MYSPPKTFVPRLVRSCEGGMSPVQASVALLCDYKRYSAVIDMLNERAIQILQIKKIFQLYLAKSFKCAALV